VKSGPTLTLKAHKQQRLTTHEQTDRAAMIEKAARKSVGHLCEVAAVAVQCGNVARRALCGGQRYAVATRHPHGTHSRAMKHTCGVAAVLAGVACASTRREDVSVRAGPCKWPPNWALGPHASPSAGEGRRPNYRNLRRQSRNIFDAHTS